ncbi:MAG: hypothetical protein IKB66_02390, partial [Clostridia bacterium]|nr:hypothetical protein [Clostridia bacterium]
FALRLTLCVAWMPALIVENNGAVNALKKNFAIVKQRFFKTYGECLLGLAFMITLLLSMTVCTMGGCNAFRFNGNTRYICLLQIRLVF